MAILSCFLAVTLMILSLGTRINGDGNCIWNPVAASDGIDENGKVEIFCRVSDADGEKRYASNEKFSYVDETGSKHVCCGCKFPQADCYQYAGLDNEDAIRQRCCPEQQQVKQSPFGRMFK